MIIKWIRKHWRRLYAREYLPYDSKGQRDDFYYNDEAQVRSDYCILFNSERGSRVLAHLKACYAIGEPSHGPGIVNDDAVFWDGQKSAIHYIDSMSEIPKSNLSSNARKVSIEPN